MRMSESKDFQRLKSSSLWDKLNSDQKFMVNFQLRDAKYREEGIRDKYFLICKRCRGEFYSNRKKEICSSCIGYQRKENSFYRLIIGIWNLIKRKRRVGWKPISIFLSEYDFMGIYCIRNNENNRFYVGCSINVSNRIRSHLNGGASNSDLQNDLVEYGINVFSFVILEIYRESIFDSESDKEIHKTKLRQIESGWIRKFRKRGLSLYN